MPVTALTELETLEVSLVPRGANMKKRFPITKSTESNSMSDTLHAVIDAPSPEDERFEAIAKEAGISDDAAVVVKAAMKIVSAYTDVIPAEESMVLISKAFPVQELVKAEDEDEEEKPEDDEEEKKKKKEFPPASEDDEEDDEEEKAKKREASVDKNEDVAKSDVVDVEKSNLSPEVKEQVQRLWKANAELETVLKQERDERLRKDYVAKAAEQFPHVPGISTDELGLLLKSLNDLDETIASKVEVILKTTNDTVSKGGLFQEIGKGSASDDSSSFSKLDVLAKEKVNKGMGSYSKAFDEALKENPGLYTDYLNEREG